MFLWVRAVLVATGLFAAMLSTCPDDDLPVVPLYAIEMAAQPSSEDVHSEPGQPGDIHSSPGLPAFCEVAEPTVSLRPSAFVPPESSAFGPGGENITVYFCRSPGR